MSLLAPDAAPQDIRWPRKTRAEELRLQLADEIVRGALSPGIWRVRYTPQRHFCHEFALQPFGESVTSVASAMPPVVTTPFVSARAC